MFGLLKKVFGRKPVQPKSFFRLMEERLLRMLENIVLGHAYVPGDATQQLASVLLMAGIVVGSARRSMFKPVVRRVLNALTEASSAVLEELEGATACRDSWLGLRRQEGGYDEQSIRQLQQPDIVGLAYHTRMKRLENRIFDLASMGEELRAFLTSDTWQQRCSA